MILILSRHVLKNITVKWLERQNCLLCQNLEASEAALLLLRLAQKVFKTEGGTSFKQLVDSTLVRPGPDCYGNTKYI